jgi:hypothetical protein
VPAAFREELEEQSKQFATKYLLAVMNSSYAKDFVNKRRRGKLDIYPDDWKPLPVMCIPVESQMEFVRIVDEILAEFEKNGYPLPLEAAKRVADLERDIDERIEALYSLVTDLR